MRLIAFVGFNEAPIKRPGNWHALHAHDHDHTRFNEAPIKRPGN